MNTLVFDIETVPDTAYGRRLHGLPDATDDEVAEVMFAKRRAEAGTDFLSHEQHRVVAISAVMRTRLNARSTTIAPATAASHSISPKVGKLSDPIWR